ncbi:MAG TPA: polysaccharide deacetylase family protein [Limnochordia bacterium]|nr:polysaccharide deacetylase family protein [Limnochordia bacterium]
MRRSTLAWITGLGLLLIAGLTGYGFGWPNLHFLRLAALGDQPSDGLPDSNGTERMNRLAEPLDLVGMFPNLVFRQGLKWPKMIALTFDDGPDYRFTPQILNILDQKGVQATFFITGVRAEAAPDVLRRIQNSGHEIENHGYKHLKMDVLTDAQIKQNLDQGADVIKRITGIQPTYFRPPYGALDVASTQAIAQDGYKIVLWTIDSLDWRGLSPVQIKANVLPKVAPGEIILFHCAGGEGEDLDGTVGALPGLIDALRSEGYTLVTVRRLLTGQAAPNPPAPQTPATPAPQTPTTPAPQAPATPAPQTPTAPAPKPKPQVPLPNNQCQC